MGALFQERLVDEALVQVCDRSGETIGTGFLVMPGVVLTCHHVAIGRPEISLQGADAGGPHPVSVQEPDLWPQFDLAVLRCRDLSGPALPIAAEDLANPPQEPWTKGFQWQGPAILGAFPLPAVIGGEVSGLAYDWGEQHYEIRRAFSLGDVDVDQGLSGAPLVDRRWGCVVGVINARLSLPGRRGFAVPLAPAAAELSRLSSLLEENRRALPRWGPYLNSRGARTICEAALTDGVEQVVSAELLLLDRYCARPDVEASIGEFLASEARVLALVGPSGVGKTTQLASLASAQLSGVATVLLSAAALGPFAGQGLAAALDSALERAARGRLPAENALESTLDALATDQLPMFVLLDAVNQAPRALRESFPEWIASSLTLFDHHEMRLILTCRPEFWELVRRRFPARLMWNGGEAGVLVVEDFSEEEAAEALQIYDLDAGTLGPSHVRHPMLARVYWELSRSGHEQLVPLVRMDALEGYVMMRCQDIALRSTLSASAVEAVLVEASRRMLAQDALALTRSEFDELDARHGGTARRLVDESLLADHGDTVRFTFDEVGELLQSRHMTLDWLQNADLVEAVGHREVAVVGALGFALARVRRSHGTDAFMAMLAPYVDALDQDGPTIAYDALIHRVATNLEDADELLPLLERWATITLEQTRGWPIYGELIARESRFSLPARLRLMRILVRHENYYDWEAHHWQAWIGSDRVSPLVAVLVEAIRDNPVPAFEQLLGWLDDETPLAGGSSATVRNLAEAVLWRHSEVAFDDLCEMLAARRPVPERLIREIGRRHPDAMVAISGRWADTCQDVAIIGLSAALDVTSPEPGLGVAAGLRKIVRAPASATLHATALAQLTRLPAERESALKDIETALIDDDPSFSSWSLNAMLESDAPRAVVLLLRLIDVHGVHVKDALGLLATYESPNCGEGEKIADALSRAWSRETNARWEIARCVEALCPRTAACTEANSRFLELINEMLFGAHGSAARGTLTYMLSFGPEKPAERPLLEAVLRMTIESAEDDTDVGHVIRTFKGDEAWADVVVECVLSYQSSDPEAFARTLLGTAGTMQFDDIAQAFARKPPPGKVGQRFLSLCAERRPVKEAAWEAAVEGRWQLRQA